MVPTDPQSAAHLLQTPAHTVALIVGDVMLDEYVSGSVDRVSPEAPVPVLRERERSTRPGGAANVATGTRALGARTELVGVVGRDPAGDLLGRALVDAGVDPGGLVVDDARPTTTKTRIVARHQQMLRIDREVDTAIGGAVRREVRERALARLSAAHVLVLQDYDKGVLDALLVGELIAAASARGVPSVVDPKLRLFFSYAGATVFKPNAAEVAAALGLETFDPEGRQLRDLADRTGCRHLLVTLGERGACLFETTTAELVRIPSVAREVYDVTGAGDATTAALAVCLARGATVRDAAEIANVAAGVAVGRLGARPVPADEILAALHHDHH